MQWYDLHIKKKVSGYILDDVFYIFLLRKVVCLMHKAVGNIADIAQLAGVSTATVSRIINNNPSVRESTRKRVQDIMSKTGYVPSVAARSLSNPKLTKNIGLIVPDAENEFFLQLLKGVTEECDRLGYTVFLFTTNLSAEKEERLLNSFREQMLSGVIMVPTVSDRKENRLAVEELMSIGIPVVLADRPMYDTQLDGVFLDDEEASRKAVNALIDAGHRRIAIISGDKNIVPHRDRRIGYEKALSQAGIPLNREYIKASPGERDQAKEQTKLLLGMQTPPTAFFTVNNNATLGALACFVESGLQLGKDISLIGVDNIEILQDLGLHTSAVERSVPEMGRTAMQLLVRRMNWDTSTPCVIQNVTLSSRLILRGSENHEGSLF